MIVRSLKSAEHPQHAKGKAYCALLKKGPRDTIDREFVRRTKSESGSEYLMMVETQPGDIYEIRRWWFDGQRQTYLGGTVWIGMDENNQPFALTRDEAFNSVLTPPIRQHGEALVPVTPTRMLPLHVEFHEAKA